MKRRDEGAALAMVLVFITVMSLWLAAVAFLTQSSNVSIRTSSTNAEYRTQIVNSALQQVMARLTDNTGAAVKRYGMDLVADDGTSLRCNEEPAKSLLATVPTKYNGRTVNVDVSCTQIADSGKQGPLASFVLTGTGQDCGTSCVAGQDGGLRISGLPSTNCTSPTGSGVGSVTRMQVRGGVINVSGAWDGVYCGTFEIQDGGQITQPDASGFCPAATFTFNETQFSRCICPTWYFTDQNNPGTCPSGTFFDDLNPNAATYNNAFIQNLVEKLGSASSSFATISNIPYGATVNTCPGSYEVLRDGPTGLYYIKVSPGTVDTTVMRMLNGLLTSCGDGSSASRPLVLFTSGVYRFANEAAGQAQTTANTLSVNGQGIRVIGGQLALSSGRPTCDTTLPGVEFQFADSTFIQANRGFLDLCSRVPSVGDQIGSTLTALTGQWTGSRGSAFLTVTAGNTVEFRNYGLILAPAGWANLGVGNNTVVSLLKGAILKAANITPNGSASTSGAVFPIPRFNGDRAVQLRFWDRSRGQDLGLVQIVIKDYFGRKPGFGYKIITWRTLW